MTAFDPRPIAEALRAQFAPTDALETVFVNTIIMASLALQKLYDQGADLTDPKVRREVRDLDQTVHRNVRALERYRKTNAQASPPSARRASPAVPDEPLPIIIEGGSDLAPYIAPRNGVPKTPGELRREAVYASLRRAELERQRLLAAEGGPALETEPEAHRDAS